MRPSQLIDRVAGRLRRDVGRREMETARIAELEARVERLTRKAAHLRERRVVQQWSAAYADSPLLRLDYDGREIKVVAAARHRTARAQTKEPWTVAWIEESFRDGDVLYDVGANVGAYSLIAATVATDGRVVAFEPGFASFAALCSNVAVNALGERILPLPVPLGAVNGLSTLRYWSLAPGAGTVDSEVAAAAKSEPVFVQQVLVQRLDDVVRTFGLPLPTHLKLDVDGAERAVLEGAAETLTSPALRTLMVELTPAAEAELVETLAGHGFEVAEQHAAREETGVRYVTFVRAAVKVASRARATSAAAESPS